MSQAPLIMHLDMDAFFASVEQADDPSLKGRPVIIGASDRGVVSAASYEARKYGVRSAIPVAQARKLCPHGVFLPGRHRRYREVSRQVMAVVSRFSPLVEQTSVDEAYLDISGLERLFGPPLELARRLKESVRETTGLTCSVGVAPNRFLAKICSDLNKPDGVYILASADVPAFLAGLDPYKISGVGKRLAETLRTLNVRVITDVLRFSRAFWADKVGDKAADFLYARAQGIGSSEIVPYSEPKSSGAENTFARDTRDPEELKRWLLRQAERVGQDLRSDNRFGRTVTLKIKFSDFRAITRSVTLPRPVQVTEDIFRAAEGLLDAQQLSLPVRLIGVSVSGLSHGERQLDLLGDPREEARVRLDKALDSLRERHGRDAVTRGRLFGHDKKE